MSSPFDVIGEIRLRRVLEQLVILEDAGFTRAEIDIRLNSPVSNSITFILRADHGGVLYSCSHSVSISLFERMRTETAEEALSIGLIQAVKQIVTKKQELPDDSA